MPHTFVPQHQGNGQQPEFTPTLPLDRRVELLQPVYEHEGQQDDILAHLCSRQNRCYPFLKAQCGTNFRSQRRYRIQVVLNRIQFGRGLKPEQAGHLLFTTQLAWGPNFHKTKTRELIGVIPELRIPPNCLCCH